MILQLGSQHYSPQRIFCIGKNYAEHVKELGGSAPGQPVVFMKPVTCLVPPGETIRMPVHGNNLLPPAMCPIQRFAACGSKRSLTTDQ